MVAWPVARRRSCHRLPAGPALPVTPWRLQSANVAWINNSLAAASDSECGPNRTVIGRDLGVTGPCQWHWHPLQPGPGPVDIPKPEC